MNKTRLIALTLSFCLLVACAPSAQIIQTAIAQTQAVWTPVPTQTPYPTQTPLPALVITKVIVWTPTPEYQDSICKPLTNMDYSDNSKIMIQLQAYVSHLPGVQSVSYTIPEKLYINTQSQIIFVNYIKTDGKLYSARYIVYVHELGWKTGTFSIDGQCWIDPPK